ncbi:MAG: CHAT domain-containing protein, partial [Hymenobacter sp.]
VVADAPTRCLISAFFEAWHQRGYSPASALQLAMQKVRQQPGWEHPYYWAPFRLMSVPQSKRI